MNAANQRELVRRDEREEPQGSTREGTQMLSFNSSSRLAAAVCACAIVASAHADAPPMTLVVNAGSVGKQVNLNPNTVTTGGIGYYFGSVSGTDGSWQVDYSFSAASSAHTAAQSGSLIIRNLSSSELTFGVVLSLPIAAAPAQTGLYNGSLSGSLTTQSGGGYISSVESMSLWMASSEGLPVASLFPAPVSISRSSAGSTSFGSQSFGGTSPSVPAALFGNNVAIALNFRLSAGSTATFSSALGGIGVPVPAPGALALLALSGFVGTRRRR